MRAYERFLNYVKVHTKSDEESGTHPSSARQFDLAKILVAELLELRAGACHDGRDPQHDLEAQRVQLVDHRLRIRYLEAMEFEGAVVLLPAAVDHQNA